MISERKRKVLFAINCVNIGGAPTVLLSHLEAIDKTRFEPWVLTLYPSKPANFTQEIRAIVGEERFVEFKLRRRSPLDFFTLFRIWRFLRKEHFDSVVTHLFLANSVVRLLACLARVPRIISFEHSVYAGKKLWQKCADFLLAKITHRIIVPHEEVAVFTAAQEHISREKFAVIPNTPRVVARDDSMLARLRVEWRVPKSPVFLAVGRFSEEKGHAIFLHALAETIRRGVQCSGVIVGHGALHDTLENLVRILGIESHCRIVADPARAKHAYYLADVFVLPSFREGFSLVTAEAVMAGLPVVASDLPAIREFVHEENGIRVRVGDSTALAEAMYLLAQDEHLRKSMSVASLGVARSLPQSRSVALLEAIL